MLDAQLQIHNDGWQIPPDLYEVRGVYHPMQFAVRVHPDIHAALSTVTRGIYSGGEIAGEVVFAFSTYFHETIHWWQHVGSTLGLMLSLCYPSQAHINHTRLLRLLKAVGPVKSLRAFKAAEGESIASEVERELNIVLNNWHDIEYCRRIALIPKLAETISHEQYFDSIGHGYEITWGACIAVMASTIDPAWRTLPDVPSWEEAFFDLRHRNVEGYYRNSRIFLIGTGARSIFEGQARFSQLQYLHFASGGTVEWDGFRGLGMLNADYVAAFERFLEMMDEPWPPSVASPHVALFLAICDIAMNPGEGFPFDIRRFETFVEDVDPGIRFFRLSGAARNRKKQLLAAVADYLPQGYVDVANTLCGDLEWRSPVEIWDRVADWPRASAEAAALIEEDRTFRFSLADLPVRVFTARFMAYQASKRQHPEFFVWPGCHSSRGSESPLPIATTMALFGEHEPLFTVVPNGEIRPTLISGRDERDIHDMFSAFYSWTAYYDVVRQWHVTDGPFTFDYSWLAPGYSVDQMKAWASGIFTRAFGISPAEFRILSGTGSAA